MKNRLDELIRLMEHQERTVDDMREHAIHSAQIPLIDEIEANIRANKKDLKEKIRSGNWRVVLAAVVLLALASASANAQQVSPITFEEVNDRFGVESTLTNLQKDRQWDAFEGKCVEWTGELSSLSEGFFGGFSIQFKHLPTTFVSDVIVSAPSSEESQLLQWNEGQRYTYRATLKRYGGAILPISADWGCS